MEPLANDRSPLSSNRLSSGFPQAIFKSPRVSQLQSGDGGTPSNRTLSIDSGSPTSVDGSPNVLDRPVLSPGLSLTDATTPSNHIDEVADHLALFDVRISV